MKYTKLFLQSIKKTQVISKNYTHNIFHCGHIGSTTLICQIKKELNILNLIKAILS